MKKIKSRTLVKNLIFIILGTICYILGGFSVFYENIQNWDRSMKVQIVWQKDREIEKNYVHQFKKEISWGPFYYIMKMTMTFLPQSAERIKSMSETPINVSDLSPEQCKIEKEMKVYCFNHLFIEKYSR